MRRRNFFGALLAGVAAFTVAPASKAEAAPEYPCHGCAGQTYESTLTGVALRMCDACYRAYERPATWDDVREARAEGYERGRAVEAARGESRRGITGAWVLSQNGDGTFVIVDAFTNQVYSGPPTREMLDALDDPSAWLRSPRAESDA